MIKNQKQAELSITLVVVVVIALVLLLVVLGITTGRLKLFGETTNKCSSRGGECKGTYNRGQPFKCPDPDKWVYIPGTECEELTQGCCQQVY